MIVRIDQINMPMKVKYMHGVAMHNYIIIATAAPYARVYMHAYLGI